MYTRLLVATGRRPSSDAVRTYTADLASDMGAELRLLTVSSALMPHTRVDGREPFAPLTEPLSDHRPAGLGLATARATDVGILQASWRTWRAVPETIVQTAVAEDCDLIIMASRQLMGPKRWLLGDPLPVVTAKASQPILVVKQPPLRRFDHPVWSRILVATSGSPGSDAAVEYGLTLAWLQELELCLLHVDRARPEADAGRGAKAGQRLLADSEARADALGLRYEGLRTDGSIVRAIVETARRQQCDLIVLGSHGTMGWKRRMVSGIAHAVAAKADLPVLLVKRAVRL